MPYTVNNLAKLSGLSIRTLHFYDEIELLKPAYIGDNGYRYYMEEELLILQQILIYREFGLPLDQIKLIIYDKEFNKIQALESHKARLAQQLERSRKIIETIDKTILHLKGGNQMNESEFYYGFDSQTQKQHEKYLLENGIVTQSFLDECNNKLKHLSGDQKRQLLQSVDALMHQLVELMTKKHSPSDEKTQSLLTKHYEWIKEIWSPDKTSYLGLMELYQSTEFRPYFDKIHPGLLEYLVKGMKVYAESIK